MTDKAWKAFERRIAKSLGTVRTPLSGGASRHTRSDTLHPQLYVECRQRGHLAVHGWYLRASVFAALEKKQTILALHETGGKLTLAVIDWDFFLKLWDCYYWAAIESGPVPDPPTLEGEE